MNITAVKATGIEFISDGVLEVELIATVAEKSISFPEAHKIAKLYDAAPDMLAALKIAVNRLDDGSAWSDEHLWELEAVVAKAEGGPAE